MKKRVLSILVCFLLILTGCSNDSSNNEINNFTNKIEESDTKLNYIKVTINGKTYKLNIENNKTAEEFINLLPQKFTMNELNGNEKYVYMNDSLTTNSFNPKHIEKGDVMLFGDNCLVIFYKSFDTNYNYTKIGHIDNLENLGSNNITAEFEK